MHVAHFRPQRLVSLTLLAAVLAVVFTLAITRGVTDLAGPHHPATLASQVTRPPSSLPFTAWPSQPLAATVRPPLVKPVPVLPFRPITMPFPR